MVAKVFLQEQVRLTWIMFTFYILEIWKLHQLKLTSTIVDKVTKSCVPMGALHMSPACVFSFQISIYWNCISWTRRLLPKKSQIKQRIEYLVVLENNIKLLDSFSFSEKQNSGIKCSEVLLDVQSRIKELNWSQNSVHWREYDDNDNDGKVANL